MYPFRVDYLSFRSCIFEHIFSSPSYFTSYSLFQFFNILFWISFTPKALSMFIKERIFPKYSRFLSIFNTLSHTHEKRVPMKHISHKKYSSFLHISERNELLGKPFEELIPSFSSFYWLEILYIICNDKFWSMITMSHSSGRLIYGNHCNTSLRAKKNYRGRIKFISVISKWSEVFFEKLIIENFFLEVSHIQFCLSLSLGNNNNELILMFSENAPYRKCGIDDCRLSRSSECHNSRKAIFLIFDEVKDFFMKPSHRRGYIVSKVDFEEKLEAFFRKFSSYTCRLLYGSQILWIYLKLLTHKYERWMNIKNIVTNNAYCSFAWYDFRTLRTISFCSFVSSSRSGVSIISSLLLYDTWRDLSQNAIADMFHSFTALRSWDSARSFIIATHFERASRDAFANALSDCIHR